MSSQTMARLHVSNVCRVEINEDLAAIATPGITPIPSGMLPPRQIRVTNPDGCFDARMKWHRDAFVPVINRFTAELLVGRGDAEYCEQSLLCYTMEDYLADPDVRKNAEELAKAQNAAADGAELAVIAVIGDDRSPLSVCRNIVSGCQDQESLQTDAEGAIHAASVFLVE